MRSEISSWVWILSKNTWLQKGKEGLGLADKHLLSSSSWWEGSFFYCGASHCVDNWNVRENKSNIFSGDVAVAIKVIAAGTESEIRGEEDTYMSKDNLILVSRLL